MFQERKEIALATTSYEQELPPFIYEDFFGAKIYDVTPIILKWWTALAPNVVGQIIEFNKKRYLYVFDIATKARACLEAEEPILEIMRWPKNRFAVIFKKKLMIFEPDAANLLRRKYVVEFEKEELEKTSVKPFPCGDYFLFKAKSSYDLIMIDAKNSKRQFLAIGNTLGQTQLFQDQIISVCTHAFESPEGLRGYETTETFLLDLSKSKWLVRKQKDSSQFNSTQEFLGAESGPFFVAATFNQDECFSRMQVMRRVQEKKSEDDTFVHIKTISIDFSKTDAHIYSVMSPQGFLFYTDNFNKLWVFNPYINKEFNLGIRYEGDLVFLDEQMFGMIIQSKEGLAKIKVFDFRFDHRHVAAIKEVMATVPISNQLEDIIVGYANPYPEWKKEDPFPFAMKP